MTNTNRNVVDISSLNTKGRSGGKRTKKLPEWIPILTWGTPDLTDRFWEDRGYGDLTEDDVQFVNKFKSESLANQHRMIDKDLELMGIRIKNVETVRNCKEVVIRL
jgi:hypothetical protein